MPDNTPPSRTTEPVDPCLRTTVPPALESIAGVQAGVEGFLHARGVDAKIVHDVSLSFEELATNIIRHSGASREPRRIGLELRCASDRIELRLTDDGPPFDPLAAPPPDVGLPIEERQAGGLGIYIVRRLSERMEYTRQGDQNIVTLRFSPGRRP